ncbi:MAG: hypothetical protein N2Z85_02435, partial [Patescibacteria group bacterium]|nr:hypothetical protein [Patescibacteria group bacterium]
MFQANINKRIYFRDNFIFDDFINRLEKNEIKGFEYLNGYKFSVVLTHDVEEQEGFNYIPRLIELENKYGFKSSYNIVPFKYKIDEGIINL